MTLNPREPEAVEIARRVTERAHCSFHDQTPEQRDALRMAQYVLADWDQRVVAKWIGADRRLEVGLSISEIELAFSKDVDGVIYAMADQARRAIKSKAELMRQRGALSKAILEQEQRP